MSISMIDKNSIQKCPKNESTLSLKSNGDSGIIYIDTNQACRILGVTPGSLYNRVYRQEIKRFKFGRLNRFLKTEIEGLITP